MLQGVIKFNTKALILGFILLLTACSQSIFANKKVLDDRSVYNEQPLIIPSVADGVYAKNTINIPNNYATSLSFNLIFNQDYAQYQNANTQLSASDTAFLNLANANTDLSQVKNQINQEFFNITQTNNNIIHKILFWKIDESLKQVKPTSEYLKIK